MAVLAISVLLGRSLTLPALSFYNCIMGEGCKTSHCGSKDHTRETALTLLLQFQLEARPPAFKDMAVFSW
jgi:hypothetical protein